MLGKTKAVLGTLLILSLLALVISQATAMPSQAISESNFGEITSSGKAIVSVKPDTAYVQLGVDAREETAAEAQAKVSESMNQVIKELKALGINESDIQTSSYHIRPEYRWDDSTQTQVLTGYLVSHQLEVIIRDIENSGKVLDQVVDAGGNRISGIRFEVSEHDLVYEKALEQAVINARKKAEAMGRGIQVSELKPVSIVEQSQYYAPYMRSDMMPMMEKSMDTQIMTGEINVTAEVLVTFRFSK